MHRKINYRCEHQYPIIVIAPHAKKIDWINEADEYELSRFLISSAWIYLNSCFWGGLILNIPKKILSVVGARGLAALSYNQSYLIAFPIFLFNRQSGAVPSSAQYSSTATILSFVTLMKDVT